MIYLKRGPAPDFWTREKVKDWTDRWLEKDCKSTQWYWPQHDKKPLNHYAREAMAVWHYNKCAFCERPLGEGDIEHFQAKTKHPLAAFVWRNLFLCCAECNRAKGEKNHQGCIKPDREDPSDYLWVNPISQKIESKPDISDETRQRAEKTIKLYKLDRLELSRLYEYLLSAIDTSQLQILASPEKPYSLMAKSFLEYLHSL